MNDNTTVMEQPVLRYCQEESTEAKSSCRVNDKREPLHLWKVLSTGTEEDLDSSDSEDSDYNPIEEESFSEEPEDDELDLDWYAEVETVDQLNSSTTTIPTMKLHSKLEQEEGEEEEEESDEYLEWKNQYEQSNARFRAIFGCDIDTESDPVAYSRLQKAKAGRRGSVMAKWGWFSLIFMLLSIQWTYCVTNLSNNPTNDDDGPQSWLFHRFMSNLQNNNRNRNHNHSIDELTTTTPMNINMLFTECLRSRNQVLHHDDHSSSKLPLSYCLQVVTKCEQLNDDDQDLPENLQALAHMYQGDIYAEKSRYEPALEQYHAGLDCLAKGMSDRLYPRMYQRFTRLNFMNMYALVRHAELREHALVVLTSEQEDTMVQILKEDAQLWLRVLRTTKKSVRHEHLRQLIIRLKQEW